MYLEPWSGDVWRLNMSSQVWQRLPGWDTNPNFVNLFGKRVYSNSTRIVLRFFTCQSTLPGPKPIRTSGHPFVKFQKIILAPQQTKKQRLFWGATKSWLQARTVHVFKCFVYGMFELNSSESHVHHWSILKTFREEYVQSFDWRTPCFNEVGHGK